MQDQTLLHLREQIEQFLLLLSQKEKHVIQRRFSLDEKNRSTLEEIGKHFQVTRERVRQIENNALQKLRRNIENNNLFTINKSAFDHINEAGGLILETDLIAKLLKTDNTFEASALQLILSLDKRFERIPNTVKYRPYIKLKTIPLEIIDSIVIQSAKLLAKSKEVMKIQELASELKKLISEQQFLNKEMLTSLYQINKSFKLIDEGVGLIEWRNIHPRTIRDKIYFVLRKKAKPIHFIDISNEIVQTSFDQKSLNLQAIHNELIRHNDFILIGRGIYALKEWGYSSGTVAEIIESTLKKKNPLHQDQIIEAVMEQRQVKPITVILNLKNKDRFVRIGRSQYTLKELATKN